MSSNVETNNIHCEWRSQNGRGVEERQTLQQKLQGWFGGQWLSRCREEVNLDESQSISLLGVRARAAACLWGHSHWRSILGVAIFLLFVPVLVVVCVLLLDAARLLPCLRPSSPCFRLAELRFEDICTFERMPLRLVSTAFIPHVYSRLHVKSAMIDISLRGPKGLEHLADLSFTDADALVPMILTGGLQNLTVDSILEVTNTTRLAYMVGYQLNEVEFQAVITTRIQVLVKTPINIDVKVPIRSNFYLTCGHVPCKAAVCKYICQFKDYPIEDPDPENPYPYVTRVEKVKMAYDSEMQYVISPKVNVWLSNFKVAATFPKSTLDLYFYNATKPGSTLGLRDRQDLDEDHRLFQMTLHEFLLQSLENSGGQPFTMNMDLRLCNTTPGHAATARDFTTRFLGKEPMYIYLAQSQNDSTCPQLRKAMLRIPPAGLSLNTNYSTKDSSDSSISNMGALTDVFRVNSVDLFSLNNTILRSFVNLTLMLPFALEGELPMLDMDGFAGPNLLGHFKAFHSTLPPVPPREGHDYNKPPEHSFGKMAMSEFAPRGEDTILLFTEAQLSPWGVEKVEAILPNFLSQLEELDIDLIGSRPSNPGNVMQTFLSGVVIKLASLEDRFVQHGGATGGRLFYTPLESHIKPRVHTEVRSISYEHSNSTGLLAYVNFTYPEAFQGRFNIRGGSMHFVLADGNSTALATVTVLNFLLSKELTHLEAEVFISDNTQAKAVHDLIDSYTKHLPLSIKVLNGFIDMAPNLKERVPIPHADLKEQCASDIETYCPGLSLFDTRTCLNRAMGSRILTYKCTKALLPRGALELGIADLAKFVNLGRGLATGVLDRITSTASKVAVNQVEILSLGTPEAPMDLQIILEEDNFATGMPDGTPVDVTARANMTLGIFEIVDLTFVVPPLAVEVLAPLHEKQNVRNVSSPLTVNQTGALYEARPKSIIYSAGDVVDDDLRSLFTLAMPAMEKDKTSSSMLLINPAIRISNIYDAMFWLEDIMSDLTDKYVVARPVSTGDVWSYMMSPIQIKVDVLTAINSTSSQSTGHPGEARSPTSLLKQPVNDTWSRILFRSASFRDVIVTETQLVFSEPWSEAVDVSIPPTRLAVYASYVKEGDRHFAPILTDDAPCQKDTRACPLGVFKAGAFRTTRGAMVVLDTNLNMTSDDDGRFWGHLLSDYVAGARVALHLRTENGAKSDGEALFDVDASFILPKMPPLNFPLTDLVNPVGEAKQHAQQDAGRKLSLAEIWTSLDPFILSVMQPVSVKIETVQLQNFESNPIDPLDLASTTLGADLVACSTVTIPGILQVALSIPPLSMHIYNGNITENLISLKNEEGERTPMPSPWASARLSEFVYDSKLGNSSAVDLHVDVLRVKQALHLAEDMLLRGENVTMTISGTVDPSASLFSRIVSHMSIQVDMYSDEPVVLDIDEQGAEEMSPPVKPSLFEKKATKLTERVFASARVASTPSELLMDADIVIPQQGNPLVMTLLAGAIDLRLILERVPEATEPLARISFDPFFLSQERDMHVKMRVAMDMSCVRTLHVLLERLRARKTTEVMLEGIVNNTAPGRFKTSVILTPALTTKLGLFPDDTATFVKVLLDELLRNPMTPFRMDSVAIVGGADGVGSPVSLPCLLKGWCDGDTNLVEEGREIVSTRIQALVSATIKDLSTFLGLPEGFFGLSIEVPGADFSIFAESISDELGSIIFQPTKLALRDGAAMSFTGVAEINDFYGLQKTVFNLWQRNFTLRLMGGANGRNDVLAAVLRLLPISVEFTAPLPGTEGYIDTLRTLPTVCDDSWRIINTTAQNFTALVDLPHLTSPVPLRMDDFVATVYYRDVPIMQARPEGGTFLLGTDKSSDHLYVTSLAAPGGAAFNACHYSSTPELCLLGEALGKILTFGDSGTFKGDILVAYRNPVNAKLTQTIRMPIQLYASERDGNPDEADIVPERVDRSPKPRMPWGKGHLSCSEARELVQDIYINLEDTISSSLRFWETVQLAMKVFMVNIFAFPLEIFHLQLTFFFRDLDGVGDTWPSMKSYPPSYDYCLLYKAELSTPDFVVAPGKGAWTPLLKPRMDETKLTESLTRLFDEVVGHKRLCADILDSVVSIKLRSTLGANDVPFSINLPMSIRSISLYGSNACEVKHASMAHMQDPNAKQVGHIGTGDKANKYHEKNTESGGVTFVNADGSIVRANVQALNNAGGEYTMKEDINSRVRYYNWMNEDLDVK